MTLNTMQFSLIRHWLKRRLELGRLLLATLLLLLGLTSKQALAADASLDGTVLSIPEVSVDGASYRIDLSLIADSDPIELALSLAEATTVSGGDSVASFADNVLYVPRLNFAGTVYWLELNLASMDPVRFQLQDFGTQVSEEDQRQQALTLFESSIENEVIQNRCVACHIDGGPARDSGLQFQRSSETSIPNNLAVLESFLDSRADAEQWILSKVSGGDNHGGGAQLPTGGSDYSNLAELLQLLRGAGSGGGASGELFFTGITLQSNLETLRRAAITLAGRPPTAAEKAEVAAGDENTLRSVLRTLMTGDGFHEFLLLGANDRLLVRGTPDGVFLDGGGLFINFVERKIEHILADRARGLDWSFDTSRFYSGIDRGLRDSPLELIAHVVENDRPYSEILTADYMMLNPIANFAVDGTATFNNPEDYSEFQPGRMPRYRAWSESTVEEELPEIQEWRIVDPGDVIMDFPHAGVINTQSFLFRYPTTATNRNRARSRWTFQHFLDIDIERSAQRTTDPVALADTNNPTMFNNNCTVCHATMDPVAGAFQNYGEEGIYKQNAGIDSLDDFYKYPDDGDSLYRWGDVWYRDMRTPGLYELEAPSSDNSLQWLAHQIVAEPSFARATVKFWWPAVFGNTPLIRPEVEEDETFQAQLMAYDEQTRTINELAERFGAEGMNLKSLLVDMVMSDWFRAKSVDESQLTDSLRQAQEYAGIGNEVLLDPERLARKTEALTGFGWGRRYEFESDRVTSGLRDEYALFYGGHDSNGITVRSKEMTALMSTVAMSHALQSSCPIVLKEFSLPDGGRRLFNGISGTVTPIAEGDGHFDIVAESAQAPNIAQIDVPLQAGAKNVQMSFTNDWCDWDEVAQTCRSDRNLVLDKLVVLNSANNQVASIEANEFTVASQYNCGGWHDDNDMMLWSNCTVEAPLQLSADDSYSIQVHAWGEQAGDQPTKLSVVVNSEVDPLQSNAAGAQAIRQKLVELHDTMLGKAYAVDSPEIDTAYRLFVETWQARMASGDDTNITWSDGYQCDYWRDDFFFDDLPIDPAHAELQYSEEGYPYWEHSEITWEFIGENGADPLHVKRSWISLMTYLLTHYHYLYE